MVWTTVMKLDHFWVNSTYSRIYFQVEVHFCFKTESSLYLAENAHVISTQNKLRRSLTFKLFIG